MDWGVTLYWEILRMGLSENAIEPNTHIWYSDIKYT